MFEKLLRTDEVAAVLDVPVNRVTTLAREGMLPAVRCGRVWRFPPSQLREWIDSGGAGSWKKPTGGSHA